MRHLIGLACYLNIAAIIFIGLGRGTGNGLGRGPAVRRSLEDFWAGGRGLGEKSKRKSSSWAGKSKKCQ